MNRETLTIIIPNPFFQLRNPISTIQTIPFVLLLSQYFSTTKQDKYLLEQARLRRRRSKKKKSYTMMSRKMVQRQANIDYTSFSIYIVVHLCFVRCNDGVEDQRGVLRRLHLISNSVVARCGACSSHNISKQIYHDFASI